MAVLNLDTAQRLDIICRKGDTFSFAFDVGDATLADSGSWEMHVRPTTEDETSPAELEADGVVDGSVITISIAFSTMENIDEGMYVYDVQLTAQGSVKTYLYGTFKVNDDVTL